METEKVDRDLWVAVVAADKAAAQARADFYNGAGARRDVLVVALRGSVWERGAALAFLEWFSDEVPELVEQLVENALSPRWALAVRRVLAGARTDAVRPVLRTVISERLIDADSDDVRRLAELLRYLNDAEALGELVNMALGSDDPEVREVGVDFSTNPKW